MRITSSYTPFNEKKILMWLDMRYICKKIKSLESVISSNNEWVAKLRES